MAGVYRPRHPERTVLYRVLFHYFDRFLAEHESRFEKEHGFLRPIPSKGWTEMIRKVYEVDPMVCPRCGATMKVIAFLTDYAVVDRLINHLRLTFVAERPPFLSISPIRKSCWPQNPGATIFRDSLF